MDKYTQLLNSYTLPFKEAEIEQQIRQMAVNNLDANRSRKVYEKMFGCLDLTSLNATDHNEQMAAFIDKVNNLDVLHGDIPNVAAVCVFPNFTQLVRSTLEADVEIAVVTGGFPASQTYTEIKVAETALAIADGADEIDMVIHLGDFLSGNYEAVCDEINEIKESCQGRILKVILETGQLKTAQNIYNASLLAIYSGTNFIKTSTGKSMPAATPQAFFTMCCAVKDYYKKTGTKIGLKVAGGVSTTEEALLYYTIAEQILGEEWLTKELFRIGASRLANSLLSSITGEENRLF